MRYFEIEYIHNNKRQKYICEAKDRFDALHSAKISGVMVKIKEIPTPKKRHFNTLKDGLLQKIFTPKMDLQTLAVSFRQLSVMANAGISIHQGVKEVLRSTDNRRLKEVFEKINDDLNAGSSLTKSMLPFKDLLKDVSIAMIELGENTGKMGESLGKLADILDEINTNQQRFKKALRYPMMVIIAIIMAFSILMIYVVPKFKSIFEKFNSELPIPTKILLQIEHITNHYGWLILSTFFAFILILRYFYTKNGKVKKWFDRHILRVYIVGDMIFYLSMSRFWLILTELVRAGIPIADSIDSALLSVSNSFIKKRLNGIKISIERGVSLTEAFKETSLHESMLLQMIQAGERSGNLDLMFAHVTSHFETRFNNLIENISSYIEPIFIAIIALMVTLLASGVLMPMWDMARAVKGG